MGGGIPQRVYRILSVSRNVALLMNRNDALAIAGFRVVSPRQPEDSVMMLEQQKVDAVVIGHSVKAPQRQKLIQGIRARWPNIPVFFVYAMPDREGEPLADESIDVTAGAEKLIAAIQQSLSREDGEAA
jgi:DNA-binding NtrC family response regulator